MASATLFVKLNNLGLFASAACILPFQSVYFILFTNGTYGDYGKLNFMAVILSSIFVFIFKSITDSSKSLRPIYFVSQLVALISFMSLACPMIIDRITKLENLTSNTSQQNATTEPLLQHTDSPSQSEKTTNNNSISPTIVDPILHDYVDYASGDWYYFISLCLLVGSMAFTISLNWSDMMNMNLSLTNYGKPCEYYRIWSCLGWILGSMVLLFSIKLGLMTLLLSTLVLFTTMATFALLIASLLWPKDPNFNSGGRFDSKINGARFKFSKNFWRSKGKTLSNCENDLSMITRGNFHNCGNIIVTKFSKTSLFDSRDENMFKNIRRCSLAPLGDSFIIKQFELDNSVGRHFYHVTKIEPSDRSDLDIPTIEYNIQNVHQLPDFCSQCSTKSKRFGLLLSLKLIVLLIRRNKFIMPKFLLLIAINGFLVAMNRYYLFPYLIWLDATRFGPLSLTVNVAVGLSEILVCLARPQFMKSINHSASLSLISILYGLRYSLYLVFTISYKTIPIEMIVLVELLYAAAGSWFCNVNVSLISNFTRLAGDCVPELIELDWIDNNMESIDRFNEGSREVMLCLSACCFNGMGLAFGSLIGGWIIENYEFTTLWIVAASVAFMTGLINILLDLNNYYKNKYNHNQPSVNEGR